MELPEKVKDYLVTKWGVCPTAAYNASRESWVGQVTLPGDWQGLLGQRQFVIWQDDDCFVLDVESPSYPDAWSPGLVWSYDIPKD